MSGGQWLRKMAGEVFQGLSFCGEAHASVDAVSSASRPYTGPTSLARMTPFMREASFYTQLDQHAVRCGLCPNDCVIDEGERGRCKTRINYHGKLNTLVYGFTYADVFPTSRHLPIAYHGIRQPSLRVGLTGCGLRCSFCFVGEMVQNAPELLQGKHVPPEKALERAIEGGASYIIFSQNEPTNNYEYTYDLSRLAKQNGMKVMVSTSGYVCKEPLEHLIPHIDAVGIGLKAFTEENYRKYSRGSLAPVLDSIKLLYRKKVTLELFYLLLPGINDGENEIRRMVSWVRDNIGVTTPVYFGRYYPSFKLKNLPQTPMSIIQKALSIADSEGLKFAYPYFVDLFLSDNIFLNDSYDKTIYCPYCGAKVLYYEFDDGIPVFVNQMQHYHCQSCRKKIPGAPGLVE